MKTIFNFILKSSADPKATSATVKFALLGAIPYFMQAVGIVCQFGYECIDVNPSLLEQLATAISSFVYFTLSTFAVIGTMWALGRKLYRTFTGINKAIQ